MPNPGATTSFQSFEREHINVVVHLPDYRLRQQLALQHGEELVVEAFSAFDEVFHLHFRWSASSDYPELSLSLASLQFQKLFLDVRLQSPQFTHLTGDAMAQFAGASASPPQFALCTWSAPLSPIEVRRSRATMPLRLDRAPTYHNDINVGLEQTVVFTLNGMLWRLDDAMLSSLHCKSYRAQHRDDTAGGSNALPSSTAHKLTLNLAAMKGAADTHPDIEIMLDVADDERPDGEAIHPHVDTQQACVTDSSASDGGAVIRGIEDGEALVVDECRESSGGSSGSGQQSSSNKHRIDVHAFVLQAHSAVFRRMLVGPMCEAAAKSIKMSGVSPAELDDFISALYGLAVPEEARRDEERLLGLMMLADRYEVLALGEECASLLEQLLTDANMATLLKVADMHQAEGLRKAALQYIVERTDRIVAVMDSDDPSIRRIVRKYLTATDNERAEGSAGTAAATSFAMPVGDDDALAVNMSEEIRV